MVAHFRLQPDPAKDGPDVGLYVRSKDRLYQLVDNVVDVINPNNDKVLEVWKPGIQGSGKPIVYDHPRSPIEVLTKRRAGRSGIARPWSIDHLAGTINNAPERAG